MIFMEKGKSIVSKFKNKLYFCPIIVSKCQIYATLDIDLCTRVLRKC